MGQGGFDFEKTILLNKVMFEDKMYLRTGFSGRDLERAIHAHGIYDERMKEAKELQKQQNSKMMAQYESLLQDKLA